MPNSKHTIHDETTDLDHDFAMMILREGGASVSVEVRKSGEVWRMQRLIPGHELELSRIDRIEFAIREAAEDWNNAK